MKMRFCNECNDKRICKKCNLIVHEYKEFEASFNFLKRKTPNEFDHMLRYVKEWVDSFVIVRLLYNLLSFFLFYICSPFFLTFQDYIFLSYVCLSDKMIIISD